MSPHPSDVPVTAPPVSGYTFAGATTHFRIYYSVNFSSAVLARARALDWLNVVELDFALANGWFRDADYLTGPVNLFLDPAGSNFAYGYGGAYWLPWKNFETHVSVTLDADFGWLRSGFMAELSEQFMKLQDRGWFHPDTGLEGTNGESLSLICARELEKQIGADAVVLGHRWYEPTWLNGTRADWVNISANDYSGKDEAVGCGNLFIYYLMFELGFTMQDVCLAAAPTLRGVYRNLTNDATDPFPQFKALIDGKYPPGVRVDSPLKVEAFPITTTPPTFPGTEYVPVPAAIVNGYVDGVSISGGTASFTTTTELSQFATGDIVIPPVTSGSPLAALDLAWQLAGNNRLTYFADGGGTYWSLQGHEAGMDVKKQTAVVGRDESVYRLFNEKIVNGIPTGAVYRCWRVKDSYASYGWVPYSDAIYSNGGQGSSVSVTPKTRTHIVATTRPGGSPVRFVFGTSLAQNQIGLGPNSSAEGLGKSFTISLDSTVLSITGSYRKKGGAEFLDQQQFVSTLNMGITTDTVVQLLISLEWTDASTFTIQAWAATADFKTVNVTLTMSGTGNDLYAAPWTHIGPIRGLFVETVNVQDEKIDGRIGPYEAPIPLRTTLQNWAIDTTALILGMTGSLWDYLSQVCVARQIDLRNDNGTIVITPMADVGYQSYMWEPVASPSISYGSDNTAKYIEVTQNLATWKPTGTTLYDTRHNSDSYSVTPGTTATFSVNTTVSATLYFNPAPVGGASSITDGMTAAQQAAASYQDALRDVAEFQTESLHGWGAYCVSGSFNGIAGHSMVAREWIAYGGSVQVKPVDATNIEVVVYAPVIPGWDGDYLLGFHGDKDYPLVRLVGMGITYREETLRFSTGANPKATTTAVGSTITNVAATNPTTVANLATRAVNDASGPSMQLSATLTMKEVRAWGLTLGMIPGSSLLYRNMQWRILSATLSNSSVSITAAPFTTYQSSYWHYNWDDLKTFEFVTYWGTKAWDDYKVAPLSGAIAEWTNSGGVVKHTLFPTPDPDNPDVPLEPSSDLFPSRFLLPYAGAFGNFATLFPGSDVFPSGEVIPGQ